MWCPIWIFYVHRRVIQHSAAARTYATRRCIAEDETLAGSHSAPPNVEFSGVDLSLSVDSDTQAIADNIEWPDYD